MKWFWSRKKRGFVLALSGGGGRGLAHLGVFLALEKVGLRPSAIVGTSIGAMFGTMYALRPEADWIKNRVLEMLRSDLFQDLNLPYQEEKETNWLSRLAAVAQQTLLYARLMTDISVARIDVLLKIIHALTEGKGFEDACTPIYITAVRFPSGECQLFSHGDLQRAIAASMAIPGVFPPVEINGERYLDGGLASEVPAFEGKVIAKPDEWVLAVNTGARPDPRDIPGSVIEILDWASRVKAMYLRRYEKRHADFLIEPLVGYTQWYDFSSPESEIEKGFEAALPELERLKRFLR